VQELLGYELMHPSFIGYVNGMHPKRVLDPDYSQKKRNGPDWTPPS
jgi:hypothetical protein